MQQGAFRTKDYITFHVGDAPVTEAGHALPGDIVEICDGKVTSVVTRAPHKQLVGTLEVAQKARYGFTSRGVPIYLFTPWNESYPPFYVGCSDKDTAKNYIAVVNFESWLPGTNCPRGSLERIIGVCGDIAAEEEGLLVHACPPYLHWKKAALEPLVRPAGEAATTPLKGETFHVDPPGCKDIDDAITISVVDAVAEVRIHIADVAQVVALNPWLERAAKIGQTIYREGAIVCGMFPKVVEEACSLLPGTIRPVVSLVFQWDLGGAGLKGEPQWVEEHICVAESYTYDTFYASEKAPLLRQITSGVAKRDLTDSHDWIAELMIFYNARAAATLQQASVGILRRHLPPEEGAIGAEWMPKFMTYKAGEYCLPGTENVAHWGLQHPVYCHASSPIRRWADCVNQLCLKSILGGKEPAAVATSTAADLNRIGKRVRAYERDLFFVGALLAGPKEIEGTIMQGSAGGATGKIRMWVPAWNRIITIRNSVLEKSQPGEILRGRIFVKPGQRNWKRRIVFDPVPRL
jgi:exoribonuclease R